MDKTQQRLVLEDEIRIKAQMLRALADTTAASSRTSPEMLLKACDKLNSVAAEIKDLADSVRVIVKGGGK